eukprot:COSAG02_NODE_2749_length_8102_cov_2.238411_5_plen_71_part_00
MVGTSMNGLSQAPGLTGMLGLSQTPGSTGMPMFALDSPVTRPYDDVTGESMNIQAPKCMKKRKVIRYRYI